MITEGLSLSDIAAVTKNNDGDGWGGNNGWWILIILFALFGGWGNRGYGNEGTTGTQGALTRGDLCMDMNFSDLESATRGIAADMNSGFRTIDNAVCTLGYNSAQLANGVQMQVANGFAGLDTNLCVLGNNIAQQFNASEISALQSANAIQSQLAQCCCENRQGQAELKFQMEQNTCAIQNTMNNNARDIIESQNCGTRAILDLINTNYTRDLENRLQKAEFAASQAAQTEQLTNQLRPCPVPAYVTCNPWANAAPYGSCGCNSY